MTEDIKSVYNRVVGEIASLKHKREEVCNNCGNCCRLKAMLNGEVYVADDYCPGLNLVTKRCRVYGFRHSRVARWLTGQVCQSIEQSLANGTQPQTCMYILTGKRVPGISMDRYIRVHHDWRWRVRKVRRWIIEKLMG
jgi:uncharacterized cysteine cluster protein YcgN (CxxCxxCC family)